MNAIATINDLVMSSLPWVGPVAAAVWVFHRTRRKPCKHCRGTGEPQGYDNADYLFVEGQFVPVCDWCKGKGTQ